MTAYEIIPGTIEMAILIVASGFVFTATRKTTIFTLEHYLSTPGYAGNGVNFSSFTCPVTLVDYSEEASEADLPFDPELENEHTVTGKVVIVEVDESYYQIPNIIHKYGGLGAQGVIIASGLSYPSFTKSVNRLNDTDLPWVYVKKQVKDRIMHDKQVTFIAKIKPMDESVALLVHIGVVVAAAFILFLGFRTPKPQGVWSVLKDWQSQLQISGV